MHLRYSMATIFVAGFALSGCSQPTTSQSQAKRVSTPPAVEKPSADTPAEVPASTPSTAASETGASTAAWGSLRGRFVYQGTPPVLEKLSTGGKDGAVCDQHPIPNESLLVDSDSRGIKNILVFARKASRVHPKYEETAKTVVEFDQKECIFLSHVLPVRVGQPLKLKNSDPIGHNTNMSPPGDQGINPLLAANADYDYQFARQQSVPVVVSCNIHPWMKAYILPRKDPYVGLSTKEGAFEILNLPAGEELEFQVWHERAAGPQSALVARPDWAQGRFRVTIKPDDVEDLGTIEIAASAFK